MTSYAGFAGLGDYLETRCRQNGLSLRELSERLGYTHSYIHGLTTKAFTPSARRVDEIARHFGDSPAMVRVLAGLQLVPPEETRQDRELLDIAAALGAKQRKALIEYARFLKQGSLPQRE